MRRARFAVAPAAVCVALAAICASAAPAAGEQLIPACSTGSGTVECKQSSWYIGPLSLNWQMIGEGKLVPPCAPTVRYETDTAENVTCAVIWKEGGKETVEFVLHDEVSELTTEATPERPPDFNGWYNHPVAVTFAGKGFSGPASCFASGTAPTVIYSGPDAVSTTVGAKCIDPAGKSAVASFGLRYDATPPSITNAFATRPPDYNDWYNHPVTFVFGGTDAMSGLEPCSATYAGPDSDAAELTGVCHDRAGNVATFTVSFRYHATPPALSMNASPQDGSVSLRWSANTRVAITRAPGLHGPRASLLYEGSAGSFTDTHTRNGVKYIYTLKAKDGAGNVTQRTIAITPGPQLIAPAPNARVTAPPLLRWTPVRGASFYNVQLFKGAKLLSTWPVHASLQLGGTWRFGGAQYRLTPGRYTWYVWPGFGSLSAGHYGALIGRRAFVVAPAPAP